MWRGCQLWKMEISWWLNVQHWFSWWKSCQSYQMPPCLRAAYVSKYQPMKRLEERVLSYPSNLKSQPVLNMTDMLMPLMMRGVEKCVDLGCWRSPRFVSIECLKLERSALQHVVKTPSSSIQNKIQHVQWNTVRKMRKMKTWRGLYLKSPKLKLPCCPFSLLTIFKPYMDLFGKDLHPMNVRHLHATNLNMRQQSYMSSGPDRGISKNKACLSCDTFYFEYNLNVKMDDGDHCCQQSHKTMKRKH